MKNLRFFFFLFLGFVIVLICIYGFTLLRQRPGFPQGIEKHRLIQVDDLKIEKEKDFEFILIRKNIGDKATFFLKSEAGIEKVEKKIIPYYSQAPFPLIYFFIGLSCLFLGFVVFVLRREEPKARIFYWMSLVFSSSLIISGGFEVMRGKWLSFLPGVLFYGLYPLAPALLLHFALSFSQRKSRLVNLLIYSPALLFMGILEASFLITVLQSSLAAHRFFHSIYPLFRLYVVVYIFLSILLLSLSYKKSRLAEERAQIKWIFYGLFVGLVPFAFLYQLPQVLKLRPLVSEELSSGFFLAIPVAFAFSIAKYKLMNIELVINRSLVYSLLTIFTLGVYLFSVQILRDIFSRFLNLRETIISVAGAVLAAAVFHPARKRIQRSVDKAFFRQSYDYRRAILIFNREAQKVMNIEKLVDFFKRSINGALFLEQIEVQILDLTSHKYVPLAATEEGSGPKLWMAVRLETGRILARKKAVQTEEDMDFSREDLLEKEKMELVIPLAFKFLSLAGFVALGKKKSGEKYTWEDLELLRTLASELALNVERIRLQEEVIYERASREKLDELNRLKTEFISSVSHELRTPMSSLQGLAEILQAGRIKDKARREELLNLMASESSRLSRFVHNILDFGKIEQQAMTYHFQTVAVQPLIEEVMQLFAASLESGGFLLRKELPEKPVLLNADPDALRQALINLLDNAIKYSTDRKEVDVLLIEREREAEIQVKDRGIGIPSDDLARIFEKFYRAPDANHLNPQGVGIGLKIVRHIMDAHRGEIKVESEPNKRTTFRLIFPRP